MEESSGKHQGETRISRRGRKRLRYLMFEVALSLVAVACKFLRVAYKILITGVDYDAVKMLNDIKRPQKQLPQAA